MEIKESLKDLDQLIQLKKWPEALLIIKNQSSPLSQSELMKLGLIYFNVQEFDLGLTTFESLSWNNYSDCAWLRRMVIAPLIKSKNFIWPIKLLKLILNKHPQSALDLSTLASLLIRQNERQEGCIYLRKILDIDKNNYDIAAQLIQLLLQDNKLDEALKLAEQYEFAYQQNERLFKIALLTLSRAEKFKLCIKHISNLTLSNQSKELGVMAAQIAFDSKEYSLAEKIINQLLELSCEDARLYLILAKINITNQNKEDEAMTFLSKAHTLDPDNIQINNLLGDLLFRRGNYSNALQYLEKLKTLLPGNPHTRLLNARALKFSGNYEEAANEMLEVVKLLPNSIKWKRYAASALVQAQRTDEAKMIFEESLAIRNKTLADTFEDGLNQLRQKIETVNLPQARFDWLWKIISNHNAMDESYRDSYEEKAKWGYLVDHYLLDWLECRPHQADEPMAFFEDLSEKHFKIEDKLNLGNGIILASAHVGCLYAGPLALELLGLPYKWIASTPSLPSLPYNNTLISTSVNTEAEVVRQIIKSLRQRNVITIAVDGAMNPAAPKIEFENQKVTYSDFAARMSFKTKSPSFFAIPYWEKSNFIFELQELPDPFPNENIEDFCKRWTQQFLKLLLNFLIKNPNNARLSGGIWRYIKSI
ncbi:Vi polysaccharide export protein VexE [Legionella busanensis]|uniref:Vi polysaccharide export protein VexE n=1 Tax=Legionella busanensis TaxID=190655 RepID=A0A378K9F5_9GAMM|nr:tetratricopeptide repeat protein [Legionella busanensis]STX81347.1 Vi polysaccharide export protein VexE [Legionella busanensis]